MSKKFSNCFTKAFTIALLLTPLFVCSMEESKKIKKLKTKFTGQVMPNLLQHFETPDPKGTNFAKEIIHGFLENSHSADPGNGEYKYSHEFKVVKDGKEESKRFTFTVRASNGRSVLSDLSKGSLNSSDLFQKLAGMINDGSYQKFAGMNNNRNYLQEVALRCSAAQLTENQKDMISEDRSISYARHMRLDQYTFVYHLLGKYPESNCSAESEVRISGLPEEKYLAIKEEFFANFTNKDIDKREK